MKSVLVTGGAGYVGSHACKLLAAAGYRPVVYDNLSRGHAHAVKWGALEHGDLADRASLRKAMRRHAVEAVMHFAAFAYVGESMDAPEAYFRNNVANTLNLLDEMVESGVEVFIFSSTCATYGVPSCLPIAEDSPQVPVNPYGESKLIVERLLRWYGERHALRYMGLRYFNAAGADPDGEIGEDHDPETHLIPLAIQAALGLREHLEIYGVDHETPDGTPIRDFVHVSDIAEAHLLGLEHLFAGGASGFLNLGTGRGYSVRQIIDCVERIAKRPVPLREGPRRAGDPAVLVAKPDRAASVLGWRAQVSDLNTIVQTALDWQRRKSRGLQTPMPVSEAPPGMRSWPGPATSLEHAHAAP